MSENGPIEPSADIRMAAHAVRELFLALTMEGFDERQALIVVGQVIAAQSQGDT